MAETRSTPGVFWAEALLAVNRSVAVSEAVNSDFSDFSADIGDMKVFPVFKKEWQPARLTGRQTRRIRDFRYDSKNSNFLP
jgi:hypothetical protein